MKYATTSQIYDAWQVDDYRAFTLQKLVEQVDDCLRQWTPAMLSVEDGRLTLMAAWLDTQRPEALVAKMLARHPEAKRREIVEAALAELEAEEVLES